MTAPPLSALTLRAVVFVTDAPLAVELAVEHPADARARRRAAVGAAAGRGVGAHWSNRPRRCKHARLGGALPSLDAEFEGVRALLPAVAHRVGSAATLGAAGRRRRRRARQRHSALSQRGELAGAAGGGARARAVADGGCDDRRVSTPLARHAASLCRVSAQFVRDADAQARRCARPLRRQPPARRRECRRAPCALARPGRRGQPQHAGPLPPLFRCAGDGGLLRQGVALLGDGSLAAAQDCRRGAAVRRAGGRLRRGVRGDRQRARRLEAHVPRRRERRATRRRRRARLRAARARQGRRPALGGGAPLAGAAAARGRRGRHAARPLPGAFAGPALEAAAPRADGAPRCRAGTSPRVRAAPAPRR